MDNLERLASAETTNNYPEYKELPTLWNQQFISNWWIKILSLSTSVSVEAGKTPERILSEADIRRLCVPAYTSFMNQYAKIERSYDIAIESVTDESINGTIALLLNEKKKEQDSPLLDSLSSNTLLGIVRRFLHLLIEQEANTIIIQSLESTQEN
jgi:hypothetical protein